MARQDFERFKQEIKEWLDGHPEEYDRFVAEVNDKSAIGLYKVFNVGMRLAPKLMRRYRAECHGDLADERKIQDYAADADTAKLLVDEFHRSGSEQSEEQFHRTENRCNHDSGCH